MNRVVDFLAALLAAAACLVGVVGCSDAALQSSSSGTPSQVVVVAGDAQQGQVDTVLPVPVRFQVLDASGRPVVNAPLHLTIVTGAGTIPQSDLTTDAQGSVVVSWTLGATAGAQQLEARVNATVAVDAIATACAPADCVTVSNPTVRLLALTTYDGSGQVVHPDVATGTGRLAGNWLAITPYPNGNSNDENPSLFRSADGFSWMIPSGLTNPVELPPSASYLSDPDIVFDDSSHQLWLYYRQVIDTRNVVLSTQSADGTHWSNPVAVLSAPSHQIVSPTVVRGAPGSPWTMWAVNSGPNGCTAASTTVERRTSTDGLTWSAPLVVDLKQPGQVIWHLDVEWLPARSEYWALYNTYLPGGSCVTDALYLARSSDGSHWTTYPSPIARRGMIDAFADIIYRSTFVVDPAADLVTLWLSGAKYDALTGYTWQAATVTRRVDDLLAIAAVKPVAGLRTAPRLGLPPPERDVGPVP